MAQDEIRLDTSMDGELEAALSRLASRISNLESKLDSIRRSGKRAGEGIEDGMGKATRATEEAGGAAKGAEPPIREVGNETAKTGTKARIGASGVDRFAVKMRKATREAGGLAGVLTALKLGGIVSGVFALAGGLSALAAGGGIAVGGLSPMVGVLAALPTLFLTVKLAMLATKLAATQLEQPLTRIKNQFAELGGVIAAGGLRSGLNYFANSLTGLSRATGVGLAGLGAELGLAARNAGDLTRSRPFLDQVAVIFAGMRPILRAILAGLLGIARALLNVVQGSLPMVTTMVQTFQQGSEWLAAWTAETLANGRMTEWLNKAYTIFTRSVGVLVDIMIGLFNIFRVGGSYASDMGASIEQSAAHFRAWTASAEGQARINQYFADSLPALREMGRLLGLLLGGLGGLGANQNVAPLIAQINDELAPAIGRLVESLVSEGGLGPAIISALAALADLLANLDFSALTLFTQGVAAVAQALVWLAQNVPGAHFLISALLGTFLGFKLLGPIFSLVAGGAQAFSWISNAAKLNGELSLMQTLLGKYVFPAIRTVATAMGGMLMTAIRGVGLALKAAFVTSPVGWIILAIVALVAGFIWLWNNVEGFRNFFIGVWEAIKQAAFVVWEALKTAWNAVVDAFVTAIKWYVGFYVAIWEAIKTGAEAVWNALVTAWNAVVDAIVTAAMWIWDHGLKQVFDVIVWAFKTNFAIIKFIVQTAIYIIMGIITLLAIAAEWAWKQIAAGANWLWEEVLRPVFNALSQAWDATVKWLQEAWNTLVTALSDAWNWLWQTVIAPLIDYLTIMWDTAMLRLSNAWNWTIGLFSSAWNWFFTNVIQPVVNGIQFAWQTLTEGIRMAWDGTVNGIATAWNWIKDRATEAMIIVRAGWDGLVGFLADRFRPVGDGLRTVWEGIQTAASKAAEIVKGAWNTVLDVIKTVWNLIARSWNSIPSITVPDWVPGIGGTSYSLPKLPMLYQGGPTPGGPALVGEHGPEALVRGGRIVGMLGTRGPEIVPDLPRGGYVVPNLATVLGGMAKPLPAPVAATVARARPEYATAAAGRDPALASAVRELARAVQRQSPPVTVNAGADIAKAVQEGLRAHRREQDARGHYDYRAGNG